MEKIKALLVRFNHVLYNYTIIFVSPPVPFEQLQIVSNEEDSVRTVLDIGYGDQRERDFYDIDHCTSDLLSFIGDNSTRMEWYKALTALHGIYRKFHMTKLKIVKSEIEEIEFDILGSETFGGLVFRNKLSDVVNTVYDQKESVEVQSAYDMSYYKNMDNSGMCAIEQECDTDNPDYIMCNALFDSEEVTHTEISMSSRKGSYDSIMAGITAGDFNKPLIVSLELLPRISKYLLLDQAFKHDVCIVSDVLNRGSEFPVAVVSKGMFNKKITRDDRIGKAVSFDPSISVINMINYLNWQDDVNCIVLHFGFEIEFLISGEIKQIRELVGRALLNKPLIVIIQNENCYNVLHKQFTESKIPVCKTVSNLQVLVTEALLEDEPSNVNVNKVSE